MKVYIYIYELYEQAKSNKNRCFKTKGYIFCLIMMRNIVAFFKSHTQNNVKHGKLWLKIKMQQFRLKIMA